MEVLKKFVKNWKFYLSGDLEPEEISSMTIKRIMWYDFLTTISLLSCIVK